MFPIIPPHPSAADADVVLLVARSHRTGRTRRHLYFNLPAASRAAHRARERGDTAHLILCRLAPLDRPEDVPTGLDAEGDV